MYKSHQAKNNDESQDQRILDELFCV